MNFKIITEWNIISLTYSNKTVLLSFSVTRRHNAFIKWTKNWRDLVTVVLLWIDNMTKTILINVLNLWLAYSFLGLVCYQHVWCCSICLEWCPATEVKREERITEPDVGFGKPPISSLWPISSNDIMPPNSSNLIKEFHSLAFKYMNLWGTVLFKPPHTLAAIPFFTKMYSVPTLAIAQAHPTDSCYCCWSGEENDTVGNFQRMTLVVWM